MPQTWMVKTNGNSFWRAGWGSVVRGEPGAVVTWHWQWAGGGRGLAREECKGESKERGGSRAGWQHLGTAQVHDGLISAMRFRSRLLPCVLYMWEGESQGTRDSRSFWKDKGSEGGIRPVVWLPFVLGSVVVVWKLSERSSCKTDLRYTKSRLESNTKASKPMWSESKRLKIQFSSIQKSTENSSRKQLGHSEYIAYSQVSQMVWMINLNSLWKAISYQR